MNILQGIKDAVKVLFVLAAYSTILYGLWLFHPALGFIGLGITMIAIYNGLN